MSGPINRLHARPANHLRTVAAPERSSRIVTALGLSAEQARGLRVWLTGAPVVVAVAWAGFGRAGGVAAVVLLTVGPIMWIVRWTRSRRRQFTQALPGLVETVSRSLRSGASFAQALSEATRDAPPVMQPELDRILDEIERGRPTWQALQRWTTRRPEPEIRIVAAGLAVASENEAGASRALEGIGQSLRDRAALHDEIRSQTAQATASMQALVFLPLGFLLIDAMGEKRTIRYLLGEPVGRVCLAAGIVLVAAGWLWMALIVRRRLPT